MTIQIDNFSVELEEWVISSNLTSFSVDVIDAAHNVSTSGTYFMINEVPVATTHSGIADGYIFSCVTPTISGGTIVTIHAENDNSEIVEEDYNLLFGYRAEFTGNIDWGPGQDIIVWSTATNTVDCPNTETFATFFETRELEYRDLSAYVYPIGKADLRAEIYPQTKAFLPGYTYTITVSGVKDYAGNQMETIVFSFTIEN